MRIKYCCTHWGYEGKSPVGFLNSVISAGFSGAEINLASGFFNDAFFEELSALRDNGFVFIAQQVLDAAIETPKDYIKRMIERLGFLAEFNPDFINSHTGKDYYSYDENCRIIDAAEEFAAKTGIAILHETHRGRFSFHLSGLLPYLEKFPNIKLTGDFSHWCCVSESMLDDQSELLLKVIPHIRHIHARVGWEQSAQVNDPFAPEWAERLATYEKWWKMILDHASKNGIESFTITPEAGPFPYMPEHPYSKKPISDQWDINIRMKNHLTSHLYATS